jgi:hypothetical protein
MTSIGPHSVLTTPLIHFQAVFPSVENAAHQVDYRLVLLGWGIVGLLGLLYSLSPRIRKMLPRYFWNHRFYQEAVRRGRETIPVETTILLFALCAAVGLTAVVWLDRIQMSQAFTTLVSALPEPYQASFTDFVIRSWIGVTLVAALTGFAAILWAGWLVVVAGRLGQRIRFDQAFMITVWPHWILLLVGGLAWITAGTAALDASLLWSLWFTGTAWAAARVWIDFRIIGRIPPLSLLFLPLTTPLLLLFMAAVLIFHNSGIDLRILWQLMTGL